MLLTALYFLWKEYFRNGIRVNDDGTNSESERISVPVIIIVSVFLISGLLESFIGIAQLYNLLPGYINSYFKVNGTFVNPDNYSGYLSTLLPFAFGVYKYIVPNSKRNLFIKYLSLITFLAVLYILPVLHERASIIASAIGIVFIFSFDSKLTSKFKAYANTVIKKAFITVSIIIALLITAKLLYNIRPVSVDGRMLIWKVTGNIIKDHPIFGSGFDSFATAYDNYQAKYFENNNATAKEKYLADNIKHADNEYLQITSDLGIAGVSLWMGLILSALLVDNKNILDYRDKSENKFVVVGAKASLISVLTVAMFSSPLRILPTFINFVFLLSSISAFNTSIERKSNFNTNFEFKIPSIISIASLSAAIVLAVLIMSYNIKLIGAYKIWGDGNDLATFGSYKESISRLQDAYGTLKNNGEFLFTYGGTLMLINNYKESLNLLEKSKINFTDPKQYINLGIYNESLNKVNEAEADYKYASNMIPGLLYPRYLLAKLLAKEKKINKFRSLCKEILSSQEKIHSIAVSQMKDSLKILLSSLTNQEQ